VEERVGEGDGDAGEDALVDLGLASAEEEAELLGAVARLLTRASLADGHECGEVVTGDKAGQAVRPRRRASAWRRRRGAPRRRGCSSPVARSTAGASAH